MHISFGQTLYQGLIRPAALQPGRDRLLQQGIEHRADGDAHDGAQYACNVAADDDGAEHRHSRQPDGLASGK